jgi:hypothetical protein
MKTIENDEEISPETLPNELEFAKIKLSLIWVACMLCYLLGDVLRIFAGEFTTGEIDGSTVGQWMWLIAGAIMVIPIIMVVLSLTMAFPTNSYVNIIVAIFFIVFNLVSIVGYKAFDIFLLVVSFGFNALTIWYARTLIKKKSLM